MQETDLFMMLTSTLTRRPEATATIKGSPKYPDIMGYARFYQTNLGVLVATEVSGLVSPPAKCKSPIFAFHIHAGNSCTGNASDPFADALTHYNPDNCPHPYHAGDLPPLFGNNGYSFQVILTDRFTVSEIIGKTMIIHAQPDDFTTQPSGNAGEKIACGVIKLF